MPHGGNSYPPALTQSYFFHYIIKFHTRFFFDCAGTKEKEAKRKCRKGDAKRGLFEKSPLLNSPKNFLATHTGHWACAPKVTYLPVSRTARCRRNVGRVHPKQRAGLSAPPQGGAGICVTHFSPVPANDYGQVWRKGQSYFLRFWRLPPRALS